MDLILDRSGGNAYLVAELAGVIRDGSDPADLPPSLRDVLLSRADSLSTDAQRLLHTASVSRRAGRAHHLRDDCPGLRGPATARAC